jgi:mRNA-degrading endonuclease RelE of RelBE toxin-antitoxin system
MNYKVKTIPGFDKAAKRLSKKFPSLEADLKLLADELSTAPDSGTSLGNNCYKVRLKIKSKGRGKSGGARVITYLYIEEATVYLLAIYDKGEKSAITDIEISRLLSEI